VADIDTAGPEVARVAARRAKQAALACILLLGVAVAILAIDNGIKRDILEAAQQARKLLDEFKLLANVENAVMAGAVEEVRKGGVKAPGETGTADGDRVDAADGVGDAPRAPAAAAGDENGRGQPEPGRKPRTQARARRDG